MDLLIVQYISYQGNSYLGISKSLAYTANINRQIKGRSVFLFYCSVDNFLEIKWQLTSII